MTRNAARIHNPTHQHNTRRLSFGWVKELVTKKHDACNTQRNTRLLWAVCRYKDVHVRFAAPYEPIPPSCYRPVFVTDRLERPHVPGPSNEGAAIIMGNSVRQWHASYHPGKRQKQANNAVQALGAYREALLADDEP